MRISFLDINHARRLYQLSIFFIIPILICMILFSISLVLITLGIIPNVNKPLEILAPNLLKLMVYSLYGWAGGCAVGFIFELSQGLRKYWSSSGLKYLYLVLAFITAIVSVLVSRQIINGITRVDPSQLAGAVALFVTLLTPIISLGITVFLLPLICCIAFFTIYACFHFILLFDSFFQNRFLGSIRWNISLFWSISRLLGSVTLTLILFIQLNNLINLTQSQISWLLTNIIVRSSYHQISDECKNYKVGEWIASIGNNNMSVAIPDRAFGFRFEKRKCN